MRLPVLAFLGCLVAVLAACGRLYSVPGDVCNDPTQNYTEEFAYECNQSL